MYHILLYCKYSRELWKQINDWIIELGMQDYNLPYTLTIFRYILFTMFTKLPRLKFYASSVMHYGIKTKLLKKNDYYNLSYMKKIVGDLENALAINSVILLYTKKTIYNAIEKEQKPHGRDVKNETKNLYYQEKYRYNIKGKKKLFEKESNIVCNVYEKKS